MERRKEERKEERKEQRDEEAMGGNERLYFKDGHPCEKIFFRFSFCLLLQ